MKRKYLGGLLVASLFFLSACALPWSDKEKSPQIVEDAPKGDNEKVTIIPQENEEDYRSLHPEKPSPTRGLITYGVSNRGDIDELETGLMRLSKDVFAPSDYFFENGRYIDGSIINSLLSRQPKASKDNKKSDKDGEKKDESKKKNEPELPGVDAGGLNPPYGEGKDIGKMAADHPKILSYILEQDYMVKNGENGYQLGGLSLAISVNSVYTESIYYRKTGKTYPVDVSLDNKKVKEAGKQYAEKVLDRVRSIQGLADVPIFIALYIESPPGEIIPGHFYAKSELGKGNNIGEWKTINEEYVLFPSNNATTNHLGDSKKFSQFKSDIESYFQNSIGVIGKGFYKKDQLRNLTLTINIRFFDKTEVISFARYVAARLQNQFPFNEQLPVQVYISSVDQPEAIIVKKPDMKKPFVHIYKTY